MKLIVNCTILFFMDTSCSLYSLAIEAARSRPRQPCSCQPGLLRERPSNLSFFFSLQLSINQLGTELGLEVLLGHTRHL